MTGLSVIVGVDPLYNEVADHTDPQYWGEYVELHTGAEIVAVGEGYDETQRLPHSIVRERCLRLVTEQAAVERCHISTPTTVAVVVTGKKLGGGG